MKKIFLIIFFTFLSIFNIYSQDTTNVDTLKINHLNDSIKTNVYSQDTISVDSCINQHKEMCVMLSRKIDSLDMKIKNQKEKDLKRKANRNTAVFISLVGLQMAFGFDPKFTIINFVWLLF